MLMATVSDLPCSHNTNYLLLMNISVPSSTMIKFPKKKYGLYMQLYDYSCIYSLIYHI